MPNSLMGELQRALRAVTGTTQTYQGDWHAYLDSRGFPAGQWDARVLRFRQSNDPTCGTASAAHNYFLYNGPAYTVSAYGYNMTASGDYFSTPSAVANQITGDITLIIELSMNDWTPASVETLVAKDNLAIGGRSYAVNVQTNGAPRLNYSLDGTNIISVTSSAVPAFTDGISAHIAVERESATGKVRFYTSQDHVLWTLLGTEQTGTSGAIFAGNADVQFGNLGALSYALTGKVYQSEIYSGLAISGSGAIKKVDFNPVDWVSGTTWVSASTGETWTINGSATVYKAS